jgi:hypothetical protein
MSEWSLGGLIILIGLLLFWPAREPFRRAERLLRAFRGTPDDLHADTHDRDETDGIDRSV